MFSFPVVYSDSFLLVSRLQCESRRRSIYISDFQFGIFAAMLGDKGFNVWEFSADHHAKRDCA